MRWIVGGLVVLAACSDGSPGTPADADPCGQPAPALDGECMAGGLAGIDLNGTWTLTGTSHEDLGGMITDRDLAEPRTFQRDGTGWCRFGAGAGTTVPGLDPETYVDDSQAMRPYLRSFDGRSTFKYTICKRSADGALWYRFDAAGYAQQRPFTQKIDGVLNR